MTLWCITNDVPDMRSCTVKDVHRQWCDGYARSWNRDTGQLEVRYDRQCRGCEPRRAEVGRLCYDHIVKLDEALRDVTPLVTFMLEDGSNGIRDTNGEGGTSSHESSWTLSESRIQVSWIIAAATNAIDVLAGDVEGIDLSFLEHRAGLAPGQRTADLTYASTYLSANRDDLIATPRGAEAAVRFADVVQRAYARFPLVETRHRIAGIRCEQCRQAQLEWRPPLMFRDDVVIECASCGWTERQEWLEQYRSIMQVTAT